MGASDNYITLRRSYREVLRPKLVSNSLATPLKDLPRQQTRYFVELLKEHTGKNEIKLSDCIVMCFYNRQVSNLSKDEFSFNSLDR